MAPRRSSRHKSRPKAPGTMVVMYPKISKSVSRGKKVVPVNHISQDVKKAIKAAHDEKPSAALQKAMEKKVDAELKKNAADLAVFKAVSVFMFSDPHFRAQIESRYGIVLGRSIGRYLRTAGLILEAIFHVWFFVSGPIRLSIKVTKFIFNIVFYACIMSICWLDGVGYIPEWLSKRLRETRVASKKSRSTSSDFKVMG